MGHKAQICVYQPMDHVVGVSNLRSLCNCKVICMSSYVSCQARDASLGYYSYTSYKITATQNDVALRFHRVRGLYFMVVIFAATVMQIKSFGPA